MLHLARKVTGAAVHCTDGEVGSLDDFYFEENRWTVRYLLVGTGRWSTGRRVLISPMSVQGEWGRMGFHLNLTREQVKNSPEFQEAETLTRDYESGVLGYYGYPAYWGAANVWGTFDNPAALVTGPSIAVTAERTATATMDPEERELRSIKRSTGYHIHARDGEIGHVDDFLIGQESWRVRYLLADTSNWIGGRAVIVSADAFERVDRERGLLYVGATRDQIAKAPAFESIEHSLDTAETGPPFTII